MKKVKHAKWRNAAIKTMLKQGPMILEELLNSTINRYGKKFVTAPTTQTAANFLRTDKRFTTTDVRRKGRCSGAYLIKKYDVNRAHPEVIALELQA